MSLIHTLFQVAILKKCVGDPISIIPLEGLRIKEERSYEEIQVEVFDHQVKKLSNKEVASIKVLWTNYLVDRAT